ncbi:unnamed protein product, partial [Didymodactylos carnosus]
NEQVHSFSLINNNLSRLDELNHSIINTIEGWWPFLAPIKPGVVNDKALLGGKVEAEMTLLLAEDAEKAPVERARAELPDPIRPKTSFLWFTSPWKTLRFVIWRNFKWPIIIGLVIFIVVLFFLIALWTVPGEIVKIITGKIVKTQPST